VAAHLSFVLFLVGMVFMLLAAVGVLRMPDLFTRMHSSTKSATLGVGCVMLGVALYFGDFAIATRAFAVTVFVFLTAPVAAHMLARAAYFCDTPLCTLTLSDDMRGCYDLRTHVLASRYGLQERLLVLRLPTGSALAGKSLAESRLGSVLGVNVVAILRRDQTHLAPAPDTELQVGDRLLVQGRAEQLVGADGQCHLPLAQGDLEVEGLVSGETGMAEVRLSPRSSLVGQTLRESGFRQRFKVNVLAIWRGDAPRPIRLSDSALQAGDLLLLRGPRHALDALRTVPDFDSFRPLLDTDVTMIHHLHQRLVALDVPTDSTLVGKTLAESHLGDEFGLTVLGIRRGDAVHLIPVSEEELQAGDTLLVEGRPEDLAALRELEDLEVDLQAVDELGDLELESEQVGLAEVRLSPQAHLVGKTLSEAHFRGVYGLSVLAVRRRGRIHRSGLRDMRLRPDDLLLVYGPRERLRVLCDELGFQVLTDEV